MQGFLSDQPLIVKVVWAGEVPLLSGEALPHGLIAHTAYTSPDGDGITRWLVPWSQIEYVKQDIAAVEGPTPTVPLPTIPVIPEA